MSVIRIGTRGSQLALWQARTVAEALQAADAAARAAGEGSRAVAADDAPLTYEIVVIKTSGDRLGEAPLSEAGGKRLFVREIEEALLDARVDVAVHSAKDMPVAAVDGLTIAAVLPREEPWDAIVLPANSPLASSLAALPPPLPHLPEGSLDYFAVERGKPLPVGGALEHLLSQLGTACTVGTSSVRRVAQLRRVLRGATFAPIRGNLDTRLRKLDEGQYDLLVLAAAGLKRLGAGDRISARLPLEACVPAPGQGAMAVQVRGDDEPTRVRVAAIDDRLTSRALAAEQAVVAALGGGCQTPVGVIAIPSAGGLAEGRARAGSPLGADRLADVRLDVHAIVMSLDGQRVVRAAISGPAEEADALGRQAAADLLAQGAAELLAEAGKVGTSGRQS